MSDTPNGRVGTPSGPPAFRSIDERLTLLDRLHELQERADHRPPRLRLVVVVLVLAALAGLYLGVGEILVEYLLVSGVCVGLAVAGTAFLRIEHQRTMSEIAAIEHRLSALDEIDGPCE